MFSLLLPPCLFSQASSLPNDGFEITREIVVEESGIHPVSISLQDTIVVDLTHNAVLYCYPEGTASFWYKIYAKKDCEISFDIYPENVNNTYNYFLYKNKGDFNVSDINANHIFPIRANLFKDEMTTTGTGLSHSSNVNYEDTCSNVKVKQFYHTAYHRVVPVIRGDVLLLNVYHIKGKDCGQQIILQANAQSQKFQSMYLTCYTAQVANVKTERKLRLPVSVIASPPLVQKIKATYVAWDSLTHSKIEAEISWTKKHINSYTVQKGEGEIILEKNTVYNIFFSAFGYKNKRISFIAKDSIGSFTHSVFLTPVKKGDDFVMDKIYFYPNTYAVKPGALTEMDKLLKYLTANPDVKVEIQGHTNGNNRIKASSHDPVEGRFTGSSKKLSKCRAETIKKYLMEKGISGDRLVTNGYGGSKMIYPNPNNQDEADKNIRVGVLILSQKEAVLSSQKVLK
jgi:outer membrane protein OmpA-like peptidoglycan-associated protein